VEVGQLAPIEVLSAQAEVATREADILRASPLRHCFKPHEKKNGIRMTVRFVD